MNTVIHEMFRAAEGRYMTRAEQQLLRDHLQKLEPRLSAMEELAAKERAIAERTIREILRAYPDCEQRHKDARDKGVRDVSLVLRYAAQAMVRDDRRWLDDTLLVWFNTILKGIGFTSPFITDTYTMLEKVASEELSGPSAELLRPFLGHVAQALAERRKVA